MPFVVGPTQARSTGGRVRTARGRRAKPGPEVAMDPGEDE